MSNHICLKMFRLANCSDFILIKVFDFQFQTKNIKEHNFLFIENFINYPHYLYQTYHFKSFRSFHYLWTSNLDFRLKQISLRHFKIVENFLFS
jgi:hypothetical protein